MKIKAFSSKGTKGEDILLPKDLAVNANLNFLAQAIRVYEERGHVGLRNTKTRSEVNRTTKKIYKQKGTGGARHGSRRANLFVGGGVVFGPRPLRRVLTLPYALRRKAKAGAFAVKAEEKELISANISGISKSKEAAELVKKLSKETGKTRFTFVLSEKNRSALRAMRNLRDVNTIFYKDANALDIFYGGVVVLDKEIFEKAKEKKVEKKVVKKAVKKSEK